MTVQIVRRGDTQFNFINASGDSSMQTASIGVLRMNGGAPLWWIVSEEYSETWTPAGGEELIDAAADRGRAALEAFSATSPGRALSQITYGEVPDGFRQITPEHGPPPALEHGVRYVLHVLGSEITAIEFDF